MINPYKKANPSARRTYVRPRRRNRRNRNKIPRRDGNNYTSIENFRVTGIDAHKYMTMKYVQSFSVSVAAGVGTQQTMNLNSIFDPDRTGVGHQPMYYDQMSALYNRYRVLRTFWKISFANNNGSYNTVVIPINGLINTAVAGVTTYDTACELQHAQYKLVPGTGGFPVVFLGNIALHVLNGCPLIEYMGDDRFEAQVGASPTELMTLAIGIYNPTVATIIVNFTVQMVFLVDLHDVISIAGS